jgi:hypothetical protein
MFLNIVTDDEINNEISNLLKVLLLFLKKLN